MKRFFYIPCLLVALCLTCAFEQTPEFQNHTFTSKIVYVHDFGKRYPDKKFSDMVSAEMPAVIFDPPLVIDEKNPQKTGIEEVDLFTTFQKEKRPGFFFPTIRSLVKSGDVIVVYAEGPNGSFYDGWMKRENGVLNMLANPHDAAQQGGQVQDTSGTDVVLGSYITEYQNKK